MMIQMRFKIRKHPERSVMASPMVSFRAQGLRNHPQDFASEVTSFIAFSWGWCQVPCPRHPEDDVRGKEVLSLGAGEDEALVAPILGVVGAGAVSAEGIVGPHLRKLLLFGLDSPIRKRPGSHPPSGGSTQGSRTSSSSPALEKNQNAAEDGIF